MANPIRPFRPVRPDASAVSRTPKPTPGLMDLLAQMMQSVDERASSRFPEGTLMGVVPDVSPRGIAKPVSAIDDLAAKLKTANRNALHIKSRVSTGAGGILDQEAYKKLMAEHGAVLDQRSDLYFQMKAEPWNTALREQWRALGEVSREMLGRLANPSR